MKHIKYCSLDEAWGDIPTPINTEVNLIRHEEKVKEANPINTPNIDFKCGFNQQPKIEPMKNEFAGMDTEDKVLLQHIKSLNLQQEKENKLIQNIINVIDKHKYTKPVKEDFSMYAPVEQGRPYDLLFLILLGLFVIYILEKK